mgnify:CR=1 FL=1
MLITEEKVLHALKVLSDQDQLTLLIQIVEKWGEKKPKTSRMALMQAEAFCKLCLLEHAWQRLKLVEEGVEKKALQVEILLQRGWVPQARQKLIVLQTIEGNHPKLESFHKRIRQGITPPSQSQAQEIIRRGDTQEMFRLAERCLCFGQAQVGKKILMHLLQREIREAQAEKQDYTPNPYIQRLLWAHKGDFTSSMSLHVLLNQVPAPDNDEGPVESTVALTESTVSGIPMPTSDNAKSKVHSPFVGLFRGEEAPMTVDELTAEVTSAFVFSDRANESTQRMDSFMDEDNGTVAIDVLEDAGAEDQYEATGAFDKSQFYKEANDDEVIVLLRGDTHTAEISQTDALDIEGKTDAPVTAPVQVEVVQKVPQVDPELAKQVQEEKRLAELEERKRSRRANTSDKKIIQGALFAVVVVVIMLLLAVWGIRRASAQSAIHRSTPMLLSADPETLNKLQSQLEIQVEKQWLSQQIHTELLAFASYMYWRDFGGDDALYEQTILMLDTIPVLNLGWVGKSVKTLTLLDLGKADSAKEVFSQITETNRQHDLVKWVDLELQLHLNQEPTWNPEIMEYPRVLVTAIAEDVMVPDTTSDNGWIQLVSLYQELGHMSVDDATEILSVLEERQWELGRNQQAEVFLLRSLFHPQPHSPKAKMLRKQAYSITPSNPDIQFWLGLDHFWSNEPIEAMGLWQACMAVRQECASGYVFVGKELALDETVVAQVLDDAPEHESWLLSYVKGDRPSISSSFWKGEPVEMEDIFWSQMVNARAEWIAGKESKDLIWYLAWKARNEYLVGQAKYAFQWGLNTIQHYPEYTRMYVLLAESAERLNKDSTPYWTQYVSQNPQTPQLAKAKNAIGR